MSNSFLALLVLSYLSGALPWSVWLGRLVAHADPRTQTDGNPGAANAFRLGGWLLGLTVLILDFLKAFVPVLVARWGLSMTDTELFWIAVMPTLGHAFSVFLGFRGGRALVTMFGVWAGLTLYQAPLIMGGAAIAVTLAPTNDAQRALVVPGSAILYLLLRGAPGWMLLLGMAQLVILVLKITVGARLRQRAGIMGARG